MKKILCVVCLLAVGLLQIFCDEYQISSFSGYTEDFYEYELNLKYDDNKDIYYLFKKDYGSVYWYTLTPEKLDTLRANVEKVKQWIQIAKENKTSVTKELPDSKISTQGTLYTSSGDWYNSLLDIDLEFHFLSVMEESEDFAIIIKGEKVRSEENKYIDIEFETMFLINNQIDYFAEAISVDSVEKAKKEHEKMKASQDLFN